MGDIIVGMNIAIEEQTAETGSGLDVAASIKTEMMLEAKGFTDVVVSMNDDGCDVVLNMGEATDAKRAQVEDIVKRKTGVSADKIVITPIQ